MFCTSSYDDISLDVDIDSKLPFLCFQVSGKKRLSRTAARNGMVTTLMAALSIAAESMRSQLIIGGMLFTRNKSVYRIA